MRDTIDSFIKCPFFMNIEKNLLCCEGFVENTCMTTKFPDRKSALKHVSQNCAEIDGGRCPMAESLFEKYRLIEEKKAREEREWYEKALRLKRLNSFMPHKADLLQKENRQQ